MEGAGGSTVLSTELPLIGWRTETHHWRPGALRLPLPTPAPPALRGALCRLPRVCALQSQCDCGIENTFFFAVNGCETSFEVFTFFSVLVSVLIHWGCGNKVSTWGGSHHRSASHDSGGWKDAGQVSSDGCQENLFQPPLASSVRWPSWVLLGSVLISPASTHGVLPVRLSVQASTRSDGVGAHPHGLISAGPLQHGPVSK